MNDKESGFFTDWPRVEKAVAAEPDGQDLFRASRRLEAEVLFHHQEHLQNLTPSEPTPSSLNA